jgi:hypothetical protein
MHMQRKQQQFLGSMYLMIRTRHQEVVGCRLMAGVPCIWGILHPSHWVKALDVEDWFRLLMVGMHVVIKDDCSLWASARGRALRPLLVANNLVSN